VRLPQNDLSGWQRRINDPPYDAPRLIIDIDLNVGGASIRDTTLRAF
jgi:hypothetical protein